MLTKAQVIERGIKPRHRASDQELRTLPYRECTIYGRVSDRAQIRSSKESIREIARLVRLAIEDGYQTGLDPVHVEAWLSDVSNGTSTKGVLTNGQVTVDIRDLGISGTLNAEDREGLASIQKRVSSGETGAVYLTEGVSRLSRAQDRILPYQLLKLLKEHKVRVRTPEGIWNPAIERDWEYLADEFEQAIGELKTMNKRMFRRKAQKASRGEFVGGPICLGFIVPVTGHKPNGEYEYGKYQPYPPHAEISERLLREYVRFEGSTIRVLKSVQGLLIPFFPPELSYMERLTSLRRCNKRANGYEISPNLITGLATNPALIGVWQWGDNEPIQNNHPAAVPEDLFIEAFEIAKRKGKSKGRAALSEPLEWQGIVQCCNGHNPRDLVSRGSRGYYSCEVDNRHARGPACMYVNAPDLDGPLSSAVLSQLDLGPCIEDIISRLEQDTTRQGLDQTKYRREISRLVKQGSAYQALLPGCVDETTAKVDRQKEAYYWEQIRSAETQLKELRGQPANAPALKAPDYSGVRAFLANLPAKWQKYSASSRNRFLRALIDKVELSGNRDLEATIRWKAGFVQKVVIHRGTKTLAERLWSQEDVVTLKRLYGSATKATLLSAFPGRTRTSIDRKAAKMGLEQRTISPSNASAPFRPAARTVKVKELAEPVSADRGTRRTVTWELRSTNPLQQPSSRGAGEGDFRILCVQSQPVEM
jgi:hypothetical protein